MPADTEFAVIEIGMNHPGEIAPLARMAQPHVALVTTVAAVHLEAFENVAGIAREKAAIFMTTFGHRRRSAGGQIPDWPTCVVR